MVINVAYGTENGQDYFVQTCCDKEHLGQACDCKNHGEKMTKKQARQVAKKISRLFNVPILKF